MVTGSLWSTLAVTVPVDGRLGTCVVIFSTTLSLRVVDSHNDCDNESAVTALLGGGVMVTSTFTEPSEIFTLTSSFVILLLATISSIIASFTPFLKASFWLSSKAEYSTLATLSCMDTTIAPAFMPPVVVRVVVGRYLIGLGFCPVATSKLYTNSHSSMAPLWLASTTPKASALSFSRALAPSSARGS